MSYTKKVSKGYYGYATYYDKGGKRHVKSAGLFKLKRDAKQAGNDLEKELDQRNMDLQDITLVAYYERWFKLYKQSNITDVTKNRYKVIGKAIHDYFDDTKLVNIRRSDYQGFINWYGANHARDSVTKLNGALRSCVGYAIDDDIITKDFTHNVQIVYDRSRKVNVEYLTNAELARLKDAVVQNLNHLSTSRYMILTAIYTGMRKAEVQALTWKDIDFLHSTITINKSWDENKKAFKPTKTSTSNRTIKVNRELLKHLADLKANGSTMVFMNGLGTIPTSNALNKCLHRIMNHVGIKKQNFTFYSLRHVHVAYLIGQGVDVYAISKRLGHSNITTTLRVYSYLIDEYKAKNDTLIISKLADLLFFATKLLPNQNKTLIYQRLRCYFGACLGYYL